MTVHELQLKISSQADVRKLQAEAENLIGLVQDIVEPTSELDLGSFLGKETGKTLLVETDVGAALAGGLRDLATGVLERLHLPAASNGNQPQVTLGVRVDDKELIGEVFSTYSKELEPSQYEPRSRMRKRIGESNERSIGPEASIEFGQTAALFAVANLGHSPVMSEDQGKERKVRFLFWRK